MRDKLKKLGEVTNDWGAKCRRYEYKGHTIDIEDWQTAEDMWEVLDWWMEELDAGRK